MSVGPSLDDLLALEREYDDMPSGAETRMLAAIEATVAVGGGGGGEPGDPGADGNGPGADGSGAGSGPGPGGSGTGGSGIGTSGAGAATTTSAMRIAPWLARAAYVGAGIVAGASGHAVLASRSSAPVEIAAPRPSASVAAVASITPIPARVAASDPSAVTASASADPPTPASSAPPAKPRSSASPARDHTRVADERADLDVARAALARGRTEACLDAIARHTRTYGEGHFAEEREVLAVQALVAAGRAGEATTRARRFREKYPTSLFGPAMDQSLAAPASKEK